MNITPYGVINPIKFAMVSVISADNIPFSFSEDYRIGSELTRIIQESGMKVRFYAEGLRLTSIDYSLMNHEEVDLALTIDKEFQHYSRIEEGEERLVRFRIEGFSSENHSIKNIIRDNPICATIAYLHNYMPRYGEDLDNYYFWNNVRDNIHKYVTVQDLHLFDNSHDSSKEYAIVNRLNLQDPRLNVNRILIEIINYRCFIDSGIFNSPGDTYFIWKYLRFEDLNNPIIPYWNLLIDAAIPDSLFANNDGRVILFVLEKLNIKVDAIELNQVDDVAISEISPVGIELLGLDPQQVANYTRRIDTFRSVLDKIAYVSSPNDAITWYAFINTNLRILNLDIKLVNIIDNHLPWIHEVFRSRHKICHLPVLRIYPEDARLAHTLATMGARISINDLIGLGISNHIPMTLKMIEFMNAHKYQFNWRESLSPYYCNHIRNNSFIAGAFSQLINRQIGLRNLNCAKSITIRNLAHWLENLNEVKRDIMVIINDYRSGILSLDQFSHAMEGAVIAREIDNPAELLNFITQYINSILVEGMEVTLSVREASLFDYLRIILTQSHDQIGIDTDDIMQGIENMIVD